MQRLIVLAVFVCLFGTMYAAPAQAKCGENGAKACLGLTCKSGLRKNDSGICKPCGRDGQRACIGNPCPGKDVIYRAGYCTKRNIACGTEGQPPCHILKGGTPCRDGLGVFSGKCGVCGSDFERACPRVERGNNCESHLKFSKGVCVPRQNYSGSQPATYVYNASNQPIFVTWWYVDGGFKTLQPGQRAKIWVPELHCLDQTHAGLADPGNETYFNVPYIATLLTTDCAQWTKVTVWTSAGAKERSDYRIRTIHPAKHKTHTQNRQAAMAQRMAQLSPGSDGYDAGVRASVRAPETHAWVIYWGEGLIEAGRLGNVTPSQNQLGIKHPDNRSDGRLRRLYGMFADQWAICRPDAPSGCKSEQLLDYPVNGVGSLWAHADGQHMVEFKLMNSQKLIAKRMGLNEVRHYRHHNKTGVNKYTNKYGNHYIFTSNHTGYFENGKTGKKTHIHRTRLRSDVDGFYHATLKGGHPVTFVVKANPIPHPTKGPSWIKVKRADDFRRKQYDRVETARNLYRAEDGETWRFRDSLSRDHLEAVWDSNKGYKRTFRRMERYINKDNLEGKWKAGSDNFEITKQKKDKLTVKNLDGQDSRVFERIYDNAFMFKHGRDRMGVTHSGFWLQLHGEPRRIIERR